MSVRIDFKRGDTFRFACQLLSDEVPIDITGYSLRSQVRHGDILVSELNVIVTDALHGGYSLFKDAASTALWPDNVTLFMDVEFTDTAGSISSTNTILIRSIRDITI